MWQPGRVDLATCPSDGVSARRTTWTVLSASSSNIACTSGPSVAFEACTAAASVSAAVTFAVNSAAARAFAALFCSLWRRNVSKSRDEWWY